MNNIIALLSLLYLLTIACTLNLESYETMESQTPEVMFTQHLSDGAKQHFPSFQKLVFITPWNKEGAKLAIKYAHKLDYVSPCWYDLTFGSEHIIIQNDKLYNQEFITTIKAANPKIKILPRVYIGSNQQALIQTIGSFESKFKQAINLIIKIVESPHFDGLVFDTPFNTMHADDKFLGLRNLIVQFANSIKMNLKQNKLLFFNMANPLGLNLALDRYAILKVDCILIQNYDNDSYFKMLQASINWAKNTKIISKPNIMLLLPFFTRRKGQGIDTKQIMKLYDNPQQQMGSAVHNDLCLVFQYLRRTQSYVPCYTYFKKALEMMKNSEIFKVGFWEAGNGLEIYYQFL